MVGRGWGWGEDMAYKNVTFRYQNIIVERIERIRDP